MATALIKTELARRRPYKGTWASFPCRQPCKERAFKDLAMEEVTGEKLPLQILRENTGCMVLWMLDTAGVVLESWWPVQWTVLLSLSMCDLRPCAGLSSYNLSAGKWAAARGGQLHGRKGNGCFPTARLSAESITRMNEKYSDFHGTFFSFPNCCSGKAVINSGGVCLSKKSSESKIFCRE